VQNWLIAFAVQELVAPLAFKGLVGVRTSSDTLVANKALVQALFLTYAFERLVSCPEVHLANHDL
jgi:hypothetical protein